MDKIPSFTIDHNHLLRGIYVSRKDNVGGDVVTTFDIRMKEPNREPVLHAGALHTIEHLAATYLRNDLTGNYLLMQGDLQPRDIADRMKRTFEFVASFEGEIPGAAPKDCGNWLLHDLPMARWESRKYVDEVLSQLKDENMTYPTIEE